MDVTPKLNIKTLRKLCSLATNLGQNSETTSLNDLVKKIRKRGFSRAMAYEYANALIFLHHIFYRSFAKEKIIVEPTLGDDKIREILEKNVVTPYSYERLKGLLPYLVRALNWACLGRRVNPKVRNEEIRKNISQLIGELNEIKGTYNTSSLSWKDFSR